MSTKSSKRGRNASDKPVASQSSRLPVQIDPIRLAKSRQIITGELPLESCKRLILLVDKSSAGDLNVSLEFDIDSEHIHHCIGTIKGMINLICQRCLEPMPWQVDIPVRLAFVNNDFEAENLKGDYETCILDSVPLVMSDIIEDEILLSLPQVPMHPDEQCSASRLLNELASDDEQAGEPDSNNPFAALASLQKRNE